MTTQEAEGKDAPQDLREVFATLLDRLSWAETMMQVNLAAIAAAEALNQLT